MILRVRFLSILEKYTGTGRVNLELKEGATLRDLLNELDRRWGERFPLEIWDRKRRKFKVSVSILADFQSVYSEETPLHDGQEVIFLRPVAGG